MLRDVFAECLRVLEPGGRMCVNVANLGRKPYRSLAGDVTTILQDELAMLLRGEVVWVKAKGAAGSCAFGSYMKASNPVLRDLTERVVIASKGRFDRAIPPKERAKLGLPHESDISKEEFLASTLDVWEIRPERARRVQPPGAVPGRAARAVHPALHLRRRRRARPVPRLRLHRGRRRAHRPALRGLRHRPRVRRHRRGAHRRRPGNPRPTDADLADRRAD